MVHNVGLYKRERPQCGLQEVRAYVRCRLAECFPTQLAISLTQTQAARNLFVYEFFKEQVSDETANY